MNRFVATSFRNNISAEPRPLLEEAFQGRETAQKPKYKDAVAALTFVASSDIPKRTISSWGDLSRVQPADPTR